MDAFSLPLQGCVIKGGFMLRYVRLTWMLCAIWLFFWHSLRREDFLIFLDGKCCVWFWHFYSFWEPEGSTVLGGFFPAVSALLLAVPLWRAWYGKKLQEKMFYFQMLLHSNDFYFYLLSSWVLSFRDWSASSFSLSKWDHVYFSAYVLVVRYISFSNSTACFFSSFVFCTDMLI